MNIRSKSLQTLVKNPKFNWKAPYDILDLDWLDDRTQPTEAEINVEVIRLQSEYDAQAYARNRKAEYNDLNQLELMTDDAANSTTSHATAIGVIKTKWPKNNTGPVE